RHIFHAGTAGVCATHLGAQPFGNLSLAGTEDVSGAGEFSQQAGFVRLLPHFGRCAEKSSPSSPVYAPRKPARREWRGPRVMSLLPTRDRPRSFRSRGGHSYRRIPRL